MTVWRALRDRLFGGTASYVVAAVLFLIVGVLAVVVVAQTEQRLYFTGREVPAVNNGGIVFYRVGGEQFTQDAPGKAPKHPQPTSVFVDRGDPYAAVIDGPNRWIDTAFVLAGFGGAAIFLVLGQAHRIRVRRRRRAYDPAVYGEGLDPEFVRTRIDALHERHRA
jgi:hypothetical protein